MEIQYYGGNCIRITTRKANIVVDDDLDKLGQKPITKESDIAVFTEFGREQEAGKVHLLINIPGEYEVSDVSIVGIPTRGYSEESGKIGNAIYKIESEEIKLAIVGNIYPILTDSQIEQIGPVNILIIPVGGNEFTLSGTDALKIIKSIEPDIVIPTHYSDKGIDYPKSQQDLTEATKQLSMEPSEVLPKLKLKASNLSETGSTRLIVLERT